MTDNLPPGPYSYETVSAKGSAPESGHVYLIDCNGRKIASLWGRGKEKIALAEMICTARDALATDGAAQ